jgi:hypothetical protein
MYCRIEAVKILAGTLQAFGLENSRKSKQILIDDIFLSFYLSYPHLFCNKYQELARSYTTWLQRE